MKESFFDGFTMSAREYLALMFSETDENGVLRMPYFDEDDPDGLPKCIQSFQMDWTFDDAMEIADEVEKFIEIINRIVVNDDGEELDDFLKKYIKSFECDRDFYSRGIKEVFEKMEEEEDLSDEDEKLYDELIAARTEEAKKRIGGKSNFYNAILRCRRSLILCKMEAPKAVINNAYCLMAKDLAINKFGIQIEE